MISQSIVSYRLLDLYELAGRLSFDGALFSSAGVIWGLTEVLEGTTLSRSRGIWGLSLALEPLSSRGRAIAVFSRDRYDFERRMGLAAATGRDSRS